MELVQRRLANLLAVKSIVTVILTVVFAALSWAGRISAEQFMTVFTVVVAFYFGTRRKSGSLRGSLRSRSPARWCPVRASRQ